MHTYSYHRDESADLHQPCGVISESSTSSSPPPCNPLSTSSSSSATPRARSSVPFQANSGQLRLHHSRHDDPAPRSLSQQLAVQCARPRRTPGRGRRSRAESAATVVARPVTDEGGPPATAPPALTIRTSSTAASVARSGVAPVRVLPSERHICARTRAFRWTSGGTTYYVH